jgi:hypothetical protein
MKKSNLLIIGTLAAGLLLAGCDHNPRSGPLTGQSNPEGAKALKAALGQPDDVIAFDGASATLTVLQDLTIGAAPPSPSVQSLSQAASNYQAAASFAAAYAPVQNLEIPYGVTFKVAAAVTVTVSEGATVIVAAGNESYKPAEITFAPKGDADAGGSVTVESGGVIDARGAITVPEDAKLEAKGTVKMTTSAILEAAGTVEVPSGGKLEGTGSVKVAGTGALTAAGEVKVAALTTAGTVTVTESGKLEATGTVKVESTATLEVKGTVTAAEVTVQGTVTVAEDAALETTLGTVTVENGGSLDAKGEVTVPEGEKITAEDGAKISGIDEDKIDVQDGADVEKIFSVNSVDDLTTAIASAKAAVTGSVTGVVHLTSDFYTNANSKNAAIVIDAGSTDNATPYIVRGLGIGSDKPALSAGVLLANDNVTLEDVKIAVINVSKAAFTPSSSYKAALSVTRSSDGSTALTNENEANNHVTVQNCDISYNITANNMAAGIYVSGARTSPSDSITITGNTINVTNNSAYATQTIVIRSYMPSVTITNNKLKSTSNAGANTDAPASALLLQIASGSIVTGSTPAITGNTLDGGQFDFYVTIRNYTDFVGVPAMFGNKFGTATTTWVTAAGESSSFYKKLLTDLLGQVKGGTGDGFGRFCLFLGTKENGDFTNFALEYYEITNGAITAINYWSPGIEGSAYKNTAMNAENNNTNAGERGRLKLNGSTLTADGKFHWTRTVEGTNLPAE